MTSGVTTNQLTSYQFIEAALRKLNVLAAGATPSSEDYTNGTLALNALLGEYRALGMPIWARNQYTFSLTASTSSYTIGTGQTINTPYPLRILQTWRNDTGNSTRIPVEIVPNYNFNLAPSSSGGSPIQLTYQPKVNTGVIQVWPTPDSTAASSSTITIVYQRPTEYVSASTDTMDFPEEWYGAIIYGLAVRLAPEWGIPLPDRQMLKKEADEYLQNALSNGTEEASFFFQIERHGF